MPNLSFIVKEQTALRLDRYVSEVLGLLTRSQIKARNLKAKINEKDVKLSRHIKPGDCLELFWEEKQAENIIPEDIPLEIVYEDEKCIVINKAQGMVVHPGAGNRQGTLANALCFRAAGSLFPDNLKLSGNSDCKCPAPKFLGAGP